MTGGRVTGMLGCELPLLAFSHCRDVVAAVTNAGGFGVLGAAAFTPEALDVELRWIDEHVDGRPYGADILVPEKVEGRGRHLTPEDFVALVPDAQRQFVHDLLARHGIDDGGDTVHRGGSRMGNPEVNEELMDVAFSHPIRLIANALGRPPASMLARAARESVPVAALVGARRHAERQLDAGVDLIVAQGGEAGGHTGEIATMVLVPEVVDAVAGRVPVLAAGGIVTGRQMAAAVALGAEGVWTGSLWLTTEEAETAPATKQKMVKATSGDTLRSRGRTGKPARQLRSAWTDAWDDPSGPGPLPMPLQSMIAEPAIRRVDQLAASGHEGALALATYFVGQGVGLMDGIRPVRRVVDEFMADYADAVDRLAAFGAG